MVITKAHGVTYPSDHGMPLKGCKKMLDGLLRRLRMCAQIFVCFVEMETLYTRQNQLISYVCKNEDLPVLVSVDCSPGVRAHLSWCPHKAGGDCLDNDYLVPHYGTLFPAKVRRESRQENMFQTVCMHKDPVLDNFQTFKR